jgi:hypothetical protein
VLSKALAESEYASVPSSVNFTSAYLSAVFEKLLEKREVQLS